ncbi:MAG: hypothetical protein ABSC01_00930 [Verrucomicrobiota bacterium]
MNRDAKAIAWTISITLIALVGLVALVALFYTEENWSGKHAWENCKRELEAKGETLDWKAYIPPPVPDGQNFFKAPKMAEWFVKPRSGNFTNELAKRLTYANTNVAVIAELVVMPPSTSASLALENPNLVLRYSSFGKAVFLPATAVETNISSPNFIIPIIEMQDVPLTTVIENLARVAHINYLLDPQTGYDQPDQNGQIKPEPTVSVRWENITAREALLALLNKYDLQLVEDPKSNVARITIKSPISPQIYVLPDACEKTEKLFEDVIGTNVIGSQSFALLIKSLAEIKPARIIMQSERTPDDKEIIALFTQFFPNDAAKLGSPKIHVERTGANSFRAVLDADSAADYLAWSEQFEPDFNLIREALKRPYARMDGDYDNVFFIPIPDYAAFRALSQTLAQRAQCYLLLGQPEKALRELSLLNDSRRPLEAPPTGKTMTLVSAMINVAVAGVYTDVVADGIRLKAWYEPQLVALKDQLKEIKLAPFLVEALKTEPAGMCHWCEITWTNKIFASVNRNLSPIPVPQGWIYQNMVNVVELDRMPLKGFDLAHDTVSPRVFDDAAQYVDNFLNHKSPYKFLAAITVLNVAKAEQTTAYNQTLANEAQIACGLERYRLAHGEYPETLDALVPQFIEQLPHDIIGGQPLHYHRTSDGNFVLYSIGWNETDDGGQIVMTKTGGTDYTNGDWVWQYPTK